MVRCGVYWWMATLYSILALSASEGTGVVFREDFEQGLSSRWKKVEFSDETKHVIRREGTNSYVEAQSDKAASGLAAKLDGVSPREATLSWRWKIDRIPPGGSDTEIKRFDHTGRLFVAFKTLLGPPRTINYVWGNEIQTGKTFHHPSSGRSRFIVLQTGNANAGKWLKEQRNIAADWKLLFGDSEPPDIVGIGFMTDSDGTKSAVIGSYDDLELRAK